MLTEERKGKKDLEWVTQGKERKGRSSTGLEKRCCFWRKIYSLEGWLPNKIGARTKELQVIHFNKSLSRANARRTRPYHCLFVFSGIGPTITFVLCVASSRLRSSFVLSVFYRKSRENIYPFIECMRPPYA